MRLELLRLWQLFVSHRCSGGEKLIALFCDLDNTILYSHRKKIEAPKRVAELLNGVEQSYITERTFDYLSSCEAVSMIAVTTRTMSQFERVKTTLEELRCEYSLILNGAMLLKNGVIDENWLKESKRIAADSEAEMDKAAELLQRYCESPLKYCDEYLAYAGASNPRKVAKQVSDVVNSNLVSTFFDSRKVYCAPVSMNKGAAIKRFLKRLPASCTIGVGDSKNDLSMLESVDIPILPESLESSITNPKKIVVPHFQVLSDAACATIERLLQQQKQQTLM